jgi:uncharacterized protein (DUF488 family)
VRLFTIGHGTATTEEFVSRLASADVRRVVDVRRYPGSRRWPWFNAAAMEEWLPEHGVTYVPATQLGGRRTPRAESPNVALRDPAFRGYADYMQTEEFRDAFAHVLEQAIREPTAVMCSETLWWRCHRRLIADVAVLLHNVDVVHIVAGKQQPHRVTEGARVVDSQTLVYSL